MKIENHLIMDNIGSDVRYIESPNHGGNFEPGYPDTIIIHYTAGGSVGSSVRTLTDPNVKTSAHLIVGRDGSITQLVPFNLIAWHAGRSSYNGRVGFNKFSISIELDNAGLLTPEGDWYVSWFGRIYEPSDVIQATHKNDQSTRKDVQKSDYWHKYTEVQIETTFELCAMLRDKYGIKHILGHDEIAPDRKIDPGPAFPMDKLRDRVLFWPIKPWNIDNEDSNTNNTQLVESFIEDNDYFNVKKFSADGLEVTIKYIDVKDFCLSGRTRQEVLGELFKKALGE